MVVIESISSDSFTLKYLEEIMQEAETADRRFAERPVRFEQHILTPGALSDELVGGG